MDGAAANFPDINCGEDKIIYGSEAPLFHPHGMNLDEAKARIGTKS